MSTPIFELPPHVVLLRNLIAHASPLYDRPNSWTANVVGWKASRWPTEAEREAYEMCLRRGFLEKRTIGVPGDCHPFEEATVLVISDSARSFLNCYEEEPKERP